MMIVVTVVVRWCYRHVGIPLGAMRTCPDCSTQTCLAKDWKMAQNMALNVRLRQKNQNSPIGQQGELQRPTRQSSWIHIKGVDAIRAMELTIQGTRQCKSKERENVAKV